MVRTDLHKIERQDKMKALPEPTKSHEMSEEYQQVVIDLLASTMVMIGNLNPPVAIKNIEKIEEYRQRLWKVNILSGATTKVVDLIYSLDQQVQIGETHE